MSRLHYDKTKASFGEIGSQRSKCTPFDADDTLRILNDLENVNPLGLSSNRHAIHHHNILLHQSKSTMRVGHNETSIRTQNRIRYSITKTIPSSSKTYIWLIPPDRGTTNAIEPRIQLGTPNLINIFQIPKYIVMQASPMYGAWPHALETSWCTIA